MEKFLIFLPVGLLWVASLIGMCVTGVLFFLNVGEGDADWEKKFWWDFCKKNIKWLAIFSPLFVLANYFIYLMF